MPNPGGHGLEHDELSDQDRIGAGPFVVAAALGTAPQPVPFVEVLDALCGLARWHKPFGKWAGDQNRWHTVSVRRLHECNVMA